MKQFNYLMLAGVLCLTACADHPDLLGGGVGLSDNQISFSTNTVNGWQGLSGGSRAAVAAGGNGPLKMESSLGHALYLHPIEQSGTYIYNSKDELITRSGAPLPNDGNLLANDNDAKTRGSKYNGTDWSTAFGVSAILTNNNTYSSYFQNQKATPSGGSWLTNNPQYWPTAGSLSFYAYAPYCDDSHQMLSENATFDVTNAKTVHYVASANDVEHQPDLIIAKHESVTHGPTEAPNSVSLNFSHVLTAITFAVGSDMVPGTVKSIAIKGVKNTGDYDLSTGQWKTSGADADFTISLGGGQGTQVNGTQDVALTSGNQTLMMIPQVFDNSTNARVEIVFNKDGQDKTLTAPLHDTQWEAGSTIIYKVSTSSLLPTLTLNKVTFPTDWSSQYTRGVLKSDYVRGDKMGLYVVDQVGNVKEANVMLTYDGNTWSFPHDKPLHLKSTNQYFTYYPYRSDGDNDLKGMPQQGSSLASTTLASANDFFHSLETAWTPSNDQSSLDKLNACDLQVAKAVISNTGSGIDLAMEHGCGLADITLGYTANYQLSNDHNYTWHSSEFVSNNFTGINPTKLSDNHYVAIVKPTVQTSIQTSDRNTKYAWKSPLVFDPAIAKVEKKTALPVDDQVHDYTLALGDIYYSDGACSHQSDVLEVNKTPIGIVGYIGQNKWTEYNTGSGHGGHALVMSLLVDGNYYRTGPNVDYGRTKVNTAEMIRNSYDKEYGSGYKETNALIATGLDVQCAKAAKNFTLLQAPKDKSTGWFLPTNGQQYAIYSQIDGGPKPNTWNIGELWGNSLAISQQLDTFLSKVGSGHYTSLLSGFVSYMGSSEYSASQVLGFESDYNQGNPGQIFFATSNNRSMGYAKNEPSWAVRPFLAF